MPVALAINDGFNQSKLTNKQATGILYLLETKIRFPKMHSTAMLGFNKYSLEHIMPKKWEARWSKEISPVFTTVGGGYGPGWGFSVWFEDENIRFLQKFFKIP
ncbi:MAG: DUF1524 domain-containing protein [Treponema sp.]|jgi:hypothetical protein|nr:DUF1524 domain-containing protein [Treponema sp.]